MPVVGERKDTNTIVLAGLRVAVGLLFLIFGEYKVFGTQFTLGGGFQFWIHRFLADGAYPFMVPILQNFVLVHGTAMAFLVAYGEFAIALGLILGVLVRTASVCGLIYMLVLLFASNYPGCTCGVLAVLRRCTGSFSLGNLLCCVCAWGCGSRSLITPQIGT